MEACWGPLMTTKRINLSSSLQNKALTDLVRDPCCDLIAHRIQRKSDGSSRVLPFLFVLALERSRLEVQRVHIDLLLVITVHLCPDSLYRAVDVVTSRGTGRRVEWAARADRG